jgi:hypothetical protein
VAVEPKETFRLLRKESSWWQRGPVFSMLQVIAALFVWNRVSAGVCLDHSQPRRAADVKIGQD